MISGLTPPTLDLCIDMCTAAWRLLTPGRVVTTLGALKKSYLGLVMADKHYPTATQNIIQSSYTSLLTRYSIPVVSFPQL